MSIEPSNSNYLSQDMILLKYSKSSNKKAKEKRFWIEHLPALTLNYNGRNNNIVSSNSIINCNIDSIDLIVELGCILEVRLGQNTKEFQPFKNAELADKSFSLIYLEKGKYKTLNLSALDEQSCRKWVTTLIILMAQEGTEIKSLQMLPVWIRKMWDSVDVNNRGDLDLDQITLLMKKCNILLSRREIKSNLKVFLPLNAPGLHLLAIQS